jgi:hypothetical protein
MSFLGALFLTCLLVAGGIYVLTHVRKLSDGLQGLYVRAATQKRNSGGWDSSLFMYDPKYWQRPFQRFMFKFGVIFVGIWLLLVAITPIGPYFSPIHLFGVSFWVGEAANVSTPGPVDRCSSIPPLNQSQALIDRLDHSEPNFASTTQDVMGRTTEGGEQPTYTQGGVRQIVEQRFYGETGRSTARIYYASGTPFALIVQNMKYAVPLSVDNNGTVQSTEERAYFLDDTGAVCSWLLNGTPQPVDDSTIESVKTYLAGVL